MLCRHAVGLFQLNSFRPYTTRAIIKRQVRLTVTQVLGVQCRNYVVHAPYFDYPYMQYGGCDAPMACVVSAYLLYLPTLIHGHKHADRLLFLVFFHF